MIGALLAFGVSPAHAIVGVLGYRVIAFWLPIAPGAVAYFQLRRTFGRWNAEDEELAEAGQELELDQPHPLDRRHAQNGPSRFGRIPVPESTGCAPC
jgi:hypothetical protein